MRRKSRRLAVGQPDFGKSFHVESTKPITYEVRPAPQLYHDIIYLASYLHDARFSFESVRQKNGSVIIDMERDRWELYQTGRNLEIIKSRLSVSSSSYIRWELVGKVLENVSRIPTLELRVKNLYLSESHWEEQHGGGELIISNPGSFRLRIKLASSSVILLSDCV